VNCSNRTFAIVHSVPVVVVVVVVVVAAAAVVFAT
jgi:hypothetical protein